MPNNGFNPTWDEKASFTIRVPELAIVEFRVSDVMMVRMRMILAISIIVIMRMRRMSFVSFNICLVAPQTFWTRAKMNELIGADGRHLEALKRQKDNDQSNFQLKSRGKTAENHLGSFFIAFPLIRKGYRNITLQVQIMLMLAIK